MKTKNKLSLRLLALGVALMAFTPMVSALGVDLDLGGNYYYPNGYYSDDTVYYSDGGYTPSVYYSDYDYDGLGGVYYGGGYGYGGWGDGYRGHRGGHHDGHGGGHRSGGGHHGGGGHGGGHGGHR